MKNSFDYYYLSGKYKDGSDYHESPFYTFSECKERAREIESELKDPPIIEAVDNNGNCYPVTYFDWVLIKALKNWNIEIDRGKREIACRPIGNGLVCYGYLNETNNGFRWDFVPPKYVIEAALKAAKSVNMKSIYL